MTATHHALIFKTRIAMRGILDLSTTKEWRSTAALVAQSAVSVTISDAVRRMNPEDMYDDTLSYLVDAAASRGQPIDLDEWNGRFSRSFRKRYSLIRAFHACRPFAGDLKPYRQHGILRMSRTLLRKLALGSFIHHADRRAILSAVQSEKIPLCEKRVYLFTDKMHALDSSQNHYLQCGSEFLQAIAIKLGLGERGILNGQGEPFLIECHVPLGIVSRTFLNEVWRFLITVYFQSQAGKRPASTPPDLCIQVVKDIPTACIKNFIRLNDRDLKYKNPNH